jgi:class 3 adenylate cyclase
MNSAATPASKAVSQAPFRVLVVDDDPDMAALLARMLTKEGMSVDTQFDGDAALAHALASNPDLILLDVMLPGLSGFEICERLKADDATALIPIVLVTALEDTPSRVRGIVAGADDFLSKPVKNEELIARVNSLRRLHETRRELESRRLTAEVQHKETIRRAFSRYISPRLAERIISNLGSDGLPFQSHAQRISVVSLFADLRGFTRLSETVAVSNIVPMLNEFFTVLTEAVHEHEGTVFSMAGDSMLVGFNVPVPQADATERAVATGRAMLQRFMPVAARWQAEHGVQTGIGVGIEAGEVVVGNVGAPTFMSYTIIGDPVNVAARLMQTALANEILIGPQASLSLSQLLGRATALDRRKVELKGKAAPVEVVSLKVAAA